MTWDITYFNISVFNTVRNLPKKIKARYVVLTERMALQGPNLGMPHTRSMGDGLFELRVKATEGIARIFYCVQFDEEIIILHSTIKKTQKLPRRAMLLAQKRLKEIKNEKALDTAS